MAGRQIYALGGNRKAANLSGIDTKKVFFWVYTNMGILSAVAGIVLSARNSSSTPKAGDGFEMDAIASSIIGGTMLTGGVGNVVGTLFGVLSLSTIQNIVSSAGLDQAWWTGITRAVMLCLFLVIQSVVMSARKKRMAESKG